MIYTQYLLLESFFLPRWSKVQHRLLWCSLKSHLTFFVVPWTPVIHQFPAHRKKYEHLTLNLRSRTRSWIYLFIFPPINVLDLYPLSCYIACQLSFLCCCAGMTEYCLVPLNRASFVLSSTGWLHTW